MTIRILLISDIHGNYPALKAIDQRLNTSGFDYIINSGDSLVYAPFPNETVSWLRAHQAISILGNTDQKVIKLISGKKMKKPGNPEKRIMYTTTAEALNDAGRNYLRSLTTTTKLKIKLRQSGKTSRKNQVKLGIFHGSPADHDEFIFADTPDSRFLELAGLTDCQIVVTGHSHSPYHKKLANVHFINPGSVGRMFDGNPSASCATLEINEKTITVQHFRIAYTIDKVVMKIRENNLPEIYATMYQQGKKLN